MIVTALTAVSCIAVAGANITARDLAKAVPSFSPADPTAVVAYAPEPGVERVFHGAELRQALLRLDYQTAGPLPDVCFDRPVEPLKEADALAAMHKALGESAKIEIVELSHAPAPRGEIVFPLTDLGNPSITPSVDTRTTDARGAASALWHGYVIYDGSKRLPVWARVTVTVKSVRAIALEELRPGVPVQAGQVAFATVEGFPERRSTPQAEAQIEGYLPRRFIAANTPVWNDAIDPPYDISRGERAAVSVSSGRAHLVIDAEAQTSGRRGDLIAFKNPESGKIFRARVDGHGTANVEAAPVNP